MHEEDDITFMDSLGLSKRSHSAVYESASVVSTMVFTSTEPVQDEVFLDHALRQAIAQNETGFNLFGTAPRVRKSFNITWALNADDYAQYGNDVQAVVTVTYISAR